MGYEYENSHEKELLRRIRNDLMELECDLITKKAPEYCFKGFSEVVTWLAGIQDRIHFAYNRDQIQNAPYRSSNPETTIDKQD